jgi:hypothetical protein
VHVLSLAHIPPGAEVTVASDWAMPLAAAEDGAATLRIPTTVGAVYGRSPLADSDDLVTATGVTHEATLEVTCAEGVVTLANTPALMDGRTRLRLDRPIDLRVTGWVPRVLHGRSATGRAVSLRFVSAPQGELPLDAVVLVDRSGSMASPAGLGAAESKHAAVVAGLRAAAEGVRVGDKISLWQFDEMAEAVQPRRGGGFLAAVQALGEPRGGTETGGAIARVLAATACRDVVLVTDGQSWALDVQAIARSGRRFTVVLIGEDALAANVGHLAALSGGQVFVAQGADTGEAVRQALAALRRPHMVAAPLEELPDEAEMLIGGMRVVAGFGGDAMAPTGGDDPLPRAVAAVAASLVLPRLPEAIAGALAEAEGLCGHLTSLVLVDEAGAVQEGIPAQRKVALMAPASAAFVGGMGRALMAAPPMPTMHELAGSPAKASDWGAAAPPPMRRTAPAGGGFPSGSAPPSLAFAHGRIDWANDAEALLRGDHKRLPLGMLIALREVAALPQLSRLAGALGVSPLLAAIALLAQADAAGDRSAERFARQVLAAGHEQLIGEAMAAASL